LSGLWIKVRNPASIAVRRERSEKIDDPRAVRADDDPAQRRYHPR
jgi:hypothetical protein